MKKKLGIITLNGYFNFGNRLQNYALTKVLEKLNFDVYTFWNKSNKEIIKDFIKSKFIFNKKYNRFNLFYKFSKKNMKELIYNNNNLNRMDYFVSGSDQVWNYNYIEKDHSLFEPIDGKPTISYAASLGTEKLPNEYWKKYNDILNKYKAISVREEKGKQILSEVIGKSDIEVLLDPTLLLSKSDWEKIEKKPKGFKKNTKYILNYFLGNLSEEEDKEIKKFAMENNCEIINILDYSDKFYCSGPQEFVYLVHNAFFVCTDSFHASVFSIIFDKSFVVFKRKGKSNYMYSRIENLINKFELKNREFDKKITIKNLEHDYKNAYKILKEEIKKSESFLIKSLNIEN